MRDLMVLGFTLIFIAISFKSTFTAYLLWGWAGLISLNAYLYGFMVSVPYVQLYAIITLVSLILRKDTNLEKFKFNRTSILFTIFAVHGFLCAIFAYPGLVSNFEILGNIVKTVLFCVLMPLFVTKRLRLHVIVTMVALAISFHGITDGLKFLASGGAHNARGIPKFGDNNHFALVLVMVLPVLLYLTQYSALKFVRIGFFGVMMLTVLAVVATGSRGGLIGMFAAATWLLLKSRRKFMGVMVIATCSLLVVQLAPATWSSRMKTIESAETDNSFMSRVTAWKVSSAIAVANPVFGGGFQAVQSYTVWAQFKDSPGLLGFIDTPQTRSGVAAHSIWFETLGDLGFVGFFIFLIMLINAFITLKEINRLTKTAGDSYRWAADLANTLSASMFVYMISGSALSAAYFEIPYFLMMLMEVIKQVILKDLGSSKVMITGRDYV
ncbi:putative O-glycosylation ligase, exosortase A system-associated [Rhodoferax sp.]|uniref:putative O-glycosylation ligase, exosortase A system-associated n=1 Tax=Rhodoferax sp. TaxID=50421 RepID=UPI0028512B63|nr:putative O-glycosylation ligase, exosortase A system-associated [Rhodoferax sp.]MDR3368502.1 putative O-glycosylation ligase, exosortase A system-associated [Rhodoferax sp.]